MNVNIFLFIVFFLILLLLLFNFINLEGNIIILLFITIIFLLNSLIGNKENFQVGPVGGGGVRSNKQTENEKTIYCSGNFL